MRLVHVVVLEDVRRGQTRQQGDQRQRDADERQFAYAQVEEARRVFARALLAGGGHRAARRPRPAVTTTGSSLRP